MDPTLDDQHPGNEPPTGGSPNYAVHYAAAQHQGNPKPKFYRADVPWAAKHRHACRHGGREPNWSNGRVGLR